MRSMTSLTTLSVLFLVSFACILLPVSASAADPIGRIVKLKGDIKVMNGTRTLAIQEGSNISVGDKIFTGPASYIKILLKDDSLFQLGPKSEFSFDKFEMRTKNDRDAIFNLTSGKLRTLIIEKNKEKSIVIKTPTASMGVRGTEILSDVYTVNGEVKTDIALLTGKLEVSFPSSGSKVLSVDMTPGQFLESAAKIDPSNAAKLIHSDIKPELKELPKAMMEQLQKPQDQGGKTFLFDVLRKDMSGSNEVEFSKQKIDPKVIQHDRHHDKKNGQEHKRPADRQGMLPVRPMDQTAVNADGTLAPAPVLIDGQTTTSEPVRDAVTVTADTVEETTIVLEPAPLPPPDGALLPPPPPPADVMAPPPPPPNTLPIAPAPIKEPIIILPPPDTVESAGASSL